jgi:protease-4
MTTLRRLLVGFLAAIGLLTVLAVVAGIVIATHLRPAAPRLAGNIVLSLDLTKGLAAGPSQGEDRLLRLVSNGKPRLQDVLDAINRGRNDTRVKGIYARLGDDVFSLATVQELRDAIAQFRSKGKFAIAFADSFGELGPGTRTYYLATAFDQIWLQPIGMLGLTGLESDTPFFKGTLGLLGVTPQFEKRSEYKTALNILTESKMTPAHREETEELLSSLAGQITAGIAKSRGLSPEAVRKLVDKGPFFAAEALEAKLVDRLGYRDEALAEASRRAGPKAQTIAPIKYLDAAGRPNRRGPEIALIYGNGLIERGGGSTGLLSTVAGGLGADTVHSAFRSAVGDRAVRAILFRIDSQGGSVVASESMWRDVAYARAHKKPVIVSMGSVAASGGYYIAADADKIVAEPATLTGSIGVIAGKLVIAGLMKKIGVTNDTAQFGANAAMFDTASEFSPEGEQRLHDFLDKIYLGFKAHVADGRHLTLEQVEALAKGRVWSGEDAKAKGLVDALGGFDVALGLAKQAAGLAATAPVKLTVFPRQKSLPELLYEKLSGENPTAGVGAAAAQLREIASLLPLLREAALFLNPAVLVMAPLGEPR